MTGLAAQDDYLYVSSRSQNRVYRYLLPYISNRSSSTQFGSGSNTRDIARDTNGDIWVASDNAEAPLRCYSSDGTFKKYVDPGIVSSATGVAIDDEGYVWVSDNEAAKIYRIDVR